jgi:hypothetical protein
MRRPLPWTFAFGILAGLGFSLASCADEDEPSQAGTAAAAGRMSAAGSGSGRAGSGTGGLAGSEASAGARAEGGADAGGGAGAGEGGVSGSDSAGQSGRAGAGGESAGEAGQAGGGAAGEAGSAGDAGAVNGEVLVCRVGCVTDDDCESPKADVRRCDQTVQRCVECTTHADCIPQESAWLRACTRDDDCLTVLGEVCVATAGSGRCAALPDPTLGCVFPGEVALSFAKFGATLPEMVEVCGKDSGRCRNYLCDTGCTDDQNFCTTGLQFGHGDTCDAASGLCTCQNDDECLWGPGRCNPMTHLCDECSRAEDCAGAELGQDTCVNGRCGCSSSTICPTSTFPNGTPLCE